MSPAPTIYLIDELTAQPGQGQALLTAYLERYAPGARSRGFTLLHQLVAPPVWLADQSNTLVFVWSLAGGAPAWWGARLASAGDPQVAAWWRESESLIASRSRRFLAATDAVEHLQSCSS